MNLAVDVHYWQESARVAGVTFTDWQACKPEQEWITRVSSVAGYEPGKFYRRELPCILELLKHVHPLPDSIVIDGYVYLGREEKPGLGKYLYDTLEGKCVVIGIAKRRFEGTPVEVELFRGKSRCPLYVTAVGIDGTEARQRIMAMCGESRLPALLKRVDHLCRGKA